MGTLYAQSPRNYHIINLKEVSEQCKEIQKIAKELKLSFSEVLETYKLLENSRLTTIRVADGDAKDEQLGGFGIIAESLISEIHIIADTFNKLANEDHGLIDALFDLKALLQDYLDGRNGSFRGE